MNWLYNKEEEMIQTICLKDSEHEVLHDDYEKKSGDVEELIKQLLPPEISAEKMNEKLSSEIKEKDDLLKQKDREISCLKNQLQTSKLRSTSNQSGNGGSSIGSKKDNEADSWKPERVPDGSSDLVDAKTPSPPADKRPRQNNTTGENGEDNKSTDRTEPKEVGIWGEKETWLKLKEEYSEECYEVLWQNEDEEQSKPYDILIQKDGKDFIYAEVKTTTGDSPHIFEITGAQWKHAKECQENQQAPEYRIYAVFKAGTPESRISVLKDPVEKFDTGELDARPLGLRLE